ncbi:CBS domain-containing protein [Mesorhizobium sp. NZP2077]|uniref:CBS domain-containing protein n=1 Tax=Mesorhizobium sp. NZP2077 TaxID=2483404 RepID=UPI001552CD5D|nr:CBS domain-containing protein [Mesorhizobium sp. NZP2077]QKC84786.1 CBS domain-containing protein [Mesorhizobium sp. NZP2077]QKD18381.1 CBS domain-containing protein [Mesorhizobium sp. NZP2077]
MQAEAIMTKPVITTHANATIAEAVELMLSNKVSCLPVTDSDGALVGIVSKSDFLRREELGTRRVRPRWLEFDLGPGTTANDYVRSNGRIIHEVMTAHVISAPPGASVAHIVNLMMQHRINNVPIVDRERVVGIITRTDLLPVLIRAMPKAGTTPPDDDLIRRAILAELQGQSWSGGDVIDVRVSDGVVELTGEIVDERQRKAAIVAAENIAGFGQVKDGLFFRIDPFSVMKVS